MQRLARYLIAVTASLISASASLVSGSYAAQLGITGGWQTAVTISIIAVVVLPTYIAKKLLVDYW